MLDLLWGFCCDVKMKSFGAGSFIARCFPDYLEELLKEIALGHGKVLAQYKDLVIYSGLKARPLWAQFVGENPEIKNFKSISDGAQLLLSQHKRWCSLSIREHRRAELIQEKVFRYKIPQLKFLQDVPVQDWGFWSLLDKNEMLICKKIDSSVPNGEVKFAETQEPPSRAYLKLWEVMTYYKIKPTKGQKVLDLGACPGGWTWVLSNVGCDVTAIDKAELDPKVLSMEGVHYLKGDAFKLGGDDLGIPDWVFSDVICYPKDLLELVQNWMEAGVKNFICTLKFKGETDWSTIHEFQKIPDSRLVHLCANKHELTFIKA